MSLDRSSCLASFPSKKRVHPAKTPAKKVPAKKVPATLPVCFPVTHAYSNYIYEKLNIFFEEYMNFDIYDPISWFLSVGCI